MRRIEKIWLWVLDGEDDDEEDGSEELVILSFSLVLALLPLLSFLRCLFFAGATSAAAWVATALSRLLTLSASALGWFVVSRTILEGRLLRRFWDDWVNNSSSIGGTMVVFMVSILVSFVGSVFVFVFDDRAKTSDPIRGMMVTLVSFVSIPVSFDGSFCEFAVSFVLLQGILSTTNDDPSETALDRCCNEFSMMFFCCESLVVL